MITPRDEILGTPTSHHGGRLALATSGASVVIPSEARDLHFGDEFLLHDFSVCLNAFGSAEIISRAIADTVVDEYPDPNSRSALRAIAERWGCSPAELILGAGAAELIHATCFAYLRSGDRVVIATPAFGEYRRAASLCGAQVQDVDMFGDGSQIARLVDTIAATGPRLVFLATPANPTGTLIARDDLHRIAECCRDADSLLVLDQAYDAFTEVPLGTPALPGHPNVLHLRSITKEHALAGVRVAFAAAPTAIVDAIERARVPWAASAFAQAAAIAAMTDAAITHARRTTALLRAEAARIQLACTAMGRVVHPSPTHYFMIRCASALTARQQLLADANILVRDCTSFGLPEWIRVAARTPAENDHLISALAQLSANND